jgi:hypothetical protein
MSIRGSLSRGFFAFFLFGAALSGVSGAPFDIDPA